MNLVEELAPPRCFSSSNDTPKNDFNIIKEPCSLSPKQDSLTFSREEVPCLPPTRSASLLSQALDSESGTTMEHNNNNKNNIRPRMRRRRSSRSDMRCRALANRTKMRRPSRSKWQCVVPSSATAKELMETVLRAIGGDESKMMCPKRICQNLKVLTVGFRLRVGSISANPGSVLDTAMPDIDMSVKVGDLGAECLAICCPHADSALLQCTLTRLGDAGNSIIVDFWGLQLDARAHALASPPIQSQLERKADEVDSLQETLIATTASTTFADEDCSRTKEKGKMGVKGVKTIDDMTFEVETVTKTRTLSIEASSTCMHPGCTSNFDAFRRRHHCRACGGLYCSGHCYRKVRVPELGYRRKVRVCHSCSAVDASGGFYLVRKSTKKAASKAAFVSATALRDIKEIIKTTNINIAIIVAKKTCIASAAAAVEFAKTAADAVSLALLSQEETSHSPFFTLRKALFQVSLSRSRSGSSSCSACFGSGTPLGLSFHRRLSRVSLRDKKREQRKIRKRKKRLRKRKKETTDSMNCEGDDEYDFAEVGDEDAAAVLHFTKLLF
eukprot:g2257.t1